MARAITEMPVPVLTGIGHEVDRTIADEVAHTCCKTPTAVADTLVDAVDDYCDRLSRLAHRVSLRARSACGMADRELTDVGRRIQRGVPVALATEARALDAHSAHVRDAAHRCIRTGTTRFDAIEARVRALDPRRVLERGYSITRTVDGAVVRAAAAVQDGEELVTETSAGSMRSRVEVP